MATVKGVWVFNDTLERPSAEIIQTVNFTSNDSNCTRMTVESDKSYVPLSYMIINNTAAHNGNAWVNEAYRTVDFGETEQTVTDEFYTWLTANAVQQSSDPSEPETDTLYTVNGSSLTAVANAIRGKTGTTGELAFPDGYVSAVNDISSVSDLSNAKDIAFGGNESGSTYVIEDETITPLFDQIQRVTKTEEALTFEEATASLLNVVPGGGLPNAESGTFGANDASIEVGFSINEGRSVSKYAGYDVYYGTTYKASEALAILGVRVFSYQIRTISVYLWDANSNLVGQVDNVTTVKQGYTDVYFSNPANVAMGEEFTISLSNHTYGATISPNYITMNSKITFVLGGKGSSNPPVSPSYEQNVLYGIGCPIIGTISTAELPDEYQIARTTMDDIANEVKRISGTTGKITTSQILTTLQSIQLQDKSITPTAEVQTITPNDGYYGLSSVMVGAITEENEAVIEIINEKMEVAANDTY